MCEKCLTLGDILNSVKVTCLSRSPTLGLILTMCSAQVSMHHAAWRIKIELTSFGERNSSQISHLQQLLADPTMKHRRNTSEQTIHCPLDYLLPVMGFVQMDGEKCLKGQYVCVMFYFWPVAEAVWKLRLNKGMFSCVGNECVLRSLL